MEYIRNISGDSLIEHDDHYVLSVLRQSDLRRRDLLKFIESTGNIPVGLLHGPRAEERHRKKCHDPAEEYETDHRLKPVKEKTCSDDRQHYKDVYDLLLYRMTRGYIEYQRGIQASGIRTEKQVIDR